MNMVIRFLKDMQAEKVNVLGAEEACEDIKLFYEAELEG